MGYLCQQLNYVQPILHPGGFTLWHKMSSWDVVFPHYRVTPFKFLFMCIYLRSFYNGKSPNSFSKVFSISCPSTYSLIYSALPFPSNFNHLSQFLLYLCITLYSVSFFLEDPSFLLIPY